MSQHTVAKPFKTPTRRFAVGQPVTEQDVTGPVPFGDWIAKGFIQAPTAEIAVDDIHEHDAEDGRSLLDAALVPEDEAA